MLKSLKNLLRNQPPGDLAHDDWSPIPVNATAQPENTMDWLFEEVEGDLMPLCSGLSLELESQKVPQAPSYLDHFSPEELEIIAQQQADPEPVPAPEPAAVPEPAAEQPSRWVDLLRTFGEHLSEAELKIIRQQLAA